VGVDGGKGGGGGDVLATEKEAWFVPEPVWTLWREEKALYCAEN